MFLLALTLSSIIFIIAGIHIYWAHGGLWPGKTKQELIDKVFGVGTQFPGMISCYMVTLFLIIIAFFPLLAINFIEIKLLQEYRSWACFLISTVFTLRGFGGYLPYFEKKWVAEFVHLNRRVYSPLCLFLALGFSILSFG